MTALVVFCGALLFAGFALGYLAGTSRRITRARHRWTGRTSHRGISLRRP